MNLAKCPQLVIYIIFGILGFVSSFLVADKFIKDNGNNHLLMNNSIGHLIGFIVISALLYWLCHTNHHTVAWIVLLFPFIVVLVLMFFIMGLVSFKKVDN